MPATVLTPPAPRPAVGLLPPPTTAAAAHPCHIERPPIPHVVQQHVEEAAHLRDVRSVLVRAPHVRLLQISRLDERIAAHLGGMAVAGPCAAALASQALDQPGTGQIFAATVLAIEMRDAASLDRLLAVTDALPVSRGGLLSAFGWVSAVQLKGLAKDLLASKSPWYREVALAACAMHGVDPGQPLANGLHDPVPALRIRALRAAGRLGRVDLLQACTAQLRDADFDCAFEAARSALLLGERGAALRALEAVAEQPDADDRHRMAALRLVLKLVPSALARALLASLVETGAPIRTVIRSVAVAGDPHHVPWLLSQVDDPKLARLAGEAFSVITGADLASLDLDRKPLDGIDGDVGPNDDPADENVALDEDDGLPWPDRAKVAAWWSAHTGRFGPGTRCFLGQPPTPAHCLDVLKTGHQRQRMAAADHLTLFAPGTALFNVAAPARRQQRLLGIGRLN